jgi:hypothetical protein
MKTLSLNAFLYLSMENQRFNAVHPVAFIVSEGRQQPTPLQASLFSLRAESIKTIARPSLQFTTVMSPASTF